MVNHAVTNGPLHLGMHVTSVVLAVMMWMPVCGPIPELRLPPLLPVRLPVPDVGDPHDPRRLADFAERPVYTRLQPALPPVGRERHPDQQAAGLLMKLAGGAYLWTLIIIIFFRWAARNEQAERRSERARQPFAGRRRDPRRWRCRSDRPACACPTTGTTPRC